MGVVIEQEVGASGSGWNLWVWLLGVVVRRYIDFIILLIPTPLVSVLFYSSIPTFCSFLKCFSFLFKYFFVITFYVLNNFFTQYKHTYGQLRASHGSHMKAAHTVLYMKKHTNVRFISCDGHQLYERGVDIEVEGVRYNYRDASRAGRLRTGPVMVQSVRLKRVRPDQFC